MTRALPGLVPASFLVLLLLAQSPADAADGRLAMLGEFSFPSGRVFQDTTVGGLSGIAYDAQRNLYYAVSDDRSELQPARFYTLEIDVGASGIGDIRIVGVTTLDSDAATPGIQPYQRNDLDPEEIVLTPERELLISSERDLQGRPWLRRFALDGTLLAELPIPEHFLPASRPGPDGQPVLARGVRANLGFEALTLTADGSTLYVANEEALAQDGPIATLDAGTLVRILRYDRLAPGWQAGSEVAYRTAPIFAAPAPATAFADNGVSAMLAVGHLWSDLDLLVMERSFSAGVGNDAWLFGTRLAGAQPTGNIAALPSPFSGPVANKAPLVRMADLGVAADNLEGMTIGPRLPNGKPSLIVVSDDNFSTFDPPQINQYLLFELNETIAQTGQPSAPPAAPPAPPRQVPIMLPRTGALAIEAPQVALGLGFLLAGLALRRLVTRRPG